MAEYRIGQMKDLLVMEGLVVRKMLFCDLLIRGAIVACLKSAFVFNDS